MIDQGEMIRLCGWIKGGKRRQRVSSVSVLSVLLVNMHCAYGGAAIALRLYCYCIAIAWGCSERICRNGSGGYPFRRCNSSEMTVQLPLLATTASLSLVAVTEKGERGSAMHISRYR